MYIPLSDNEFKHDGYVSDKLCLIGAIIGDIVGSVHELKGTRIKTNQVGDIYYRPESTVFNNSAICYNTRLKERYKNQPLDYDSRDSYFDCIVVCL